MKFPLTYQQVQDILNDNLEMMDGDLYEKLYEYYLPEMPYGVAKARDGDPDQWIFARLEAEYG